MRRRRNGKRKEVLLEAKEKGYYVDAVGNVFNKKGKKLKTWMYGEYPAFGVFIKRMKFNVHIHRLQAYQKFGAEMFKYGILVRHMDGDKMNPAESNLELGTDFDNHHDNSEETKERMYANLTNYTKTDAEIEAEIEEMGF